MGCLRTLNCKSRCVVSSLRLSVCLSVVCRSVYLRSQFWAVWETRRSDCVFSEIISAHQAQNQKQRHTGVRFNYYSPVSFTIQRLERKKKKTKKPNLGSHWTQLCCVPSEKGFSMSRKVSTSELEEMREAFEKVGEYNNSCWNKSFQPRRRNDDNLISNGSVMEEKNQSVVSAKHLQMRRC